MKPAAVKTICLLLWASPSFAQNFDTILYRIQHNYVHQVPLEKITRKGIDALFAHLDPFSYYMSPAEAQDFRINLASKFGGTGMFLGMVDGQITVLKVFEGKPAQRAGISAGDQLLEVDQVSTRGKSIEEVFPRLRGLAGTKVNILVRSAGKTAARKVEIEREEIKITSVPYFGMIDEHIGYISLTAMTENCSDDVLAAITDLQKRPGLRGLILDLRNNPGGLLREGYRIANFFVEKGRMVVSVKGRTDDSTYYASEAAIAPSVPLVVLTSNITASSAEVLCGALQDNDRAVIIGQKTFGKGLVGQVFTMGEGAEAVITTAFYYTPSGRCIQAKNHWTEGIGFGGDSLNKKFLTRNGRPVKATDGIMPDIELPMKADPPILACLRDNNHVFKYVTEYMLRSHAYTPGKPVSLSENEYASFVQGLPAGGCSYTTATEEKLQELKSSAEKEGYLKNIEPLLKQMQEKINVEKKNALAMYKAEIKSMLEQEIAGRYEYERGRIANSLKSDASVKKAVEILKDTAGMKKILAMNQ